MTKLESAQVYCNRGKDKQIVVNTYNGKLVKKEKTIDAKTWLNLKSTLLSGRKNCTQYDSIYKISQKTKNGYDREHIRGCQGLKTDYRDIA